MIELVKLFKLNLLSIDFEKTQIDDTTISNERGILSFHYVTLVDPIIVYVLYKNVDCTTTSRRKLLYDIQIKVGNQMTKRYTPLLKQIDILKHLYYGHQTSVATYLLNITLAESLFQQVMDCMVSKVG